MFNLKTEAANIVKQLRSAGHAAFFVGGCVRDLALGKEPKDYDIATSARPDEVMRLFPKTVAVGAQFGVVRVVAANHHFEVATFRCDGHYQDGRRPEQVIYTDDPKQDVLRRDFTINGLLYDPIAETTLDFVGGLKDIDQRMLRAIGEPGQRFLEDHLRLMRAVRFSTRFSFQLEPGTRSAIVSLSQKIKLVSQERIRDELIKMLTEGYAAKAVGLLDEVRLLEHILPEVTALKGVPQPPEFHPEGDVWVHTLLMLELMDQTKIARSAGELRVRDKTSFQSAGHLTDQADAPHASELAPEQDYPNPTLAMAVLLHDVGKPQTFEISDRIRFNHHAEIGAGLAARICDRLRFTGKQTDQIVALVRDHLKFKDIRQMRPSTLKRFLRQNCFEEHLELHRLDCLGSHLNLDNWTYAKEMVETAEPQEIRPPSLLTGDDLISMGYQPGPLFKEILRSVEDAQLESVIRSRNDAESFVLSKFPLKKITS